MDQHREDFLRQVGIRADLLRLGADAFDHDALTGGVAHD